MKKLLLITLLAINATSFAQTNTIFISKPKDVVVSADKMNVLYLGVDNPVSIAVAGRSLANIKVVVQNGTIAGAGGKYNVHPNKLGKFTFYIYDKTTLIDSVLFRVKSVPSPTTMAGGKRDGDNITTAELNALAGIVAVLENFDFDMMIKITSFDLSAMNGGTLISTTSNSNMLTPQQKQVLQTLKAGNKVYFENVKCQFPDGSTRMIPGLVLRVI